MAKTLVVKLAGTVDNPDLRKLGEMRIKIDPLSTAPGGNKTLSQYTQEFIFEANEPVTLSLTGDGHFTDTTLTQDLGKSISSAGGTFYVSDGYSTLSILNKYAINYMRIGRGSPAVGDNHSHWHINLADFAGMSALKKLHLQYLMGEGYIVLSELSKSNLLEHLVVSVIGVDTGVIGDLSDLRNLTNMTFLGFPYNERDISISGDISNLAGLTQMTSLFLNNCTKLTGDTSSIAHLHPNNGGKLTTFVYTGTGITGTWPPASE